MESILKIYIIILGNISEADYETLFLIFMKCNILVYSKPYKYVPKFSITKFPYIEKYHAADGF